MIGSTAMTAIVLLTVIPRATAHGYLAVPMSRNWKARMPPHDGQTEYCPHCLSGGGVGAVSAIVPQYPYPETVATAARHGLCGDPAGPSQRYLANGPILSSYTAGQTITVEAVITTHHRGHFELFICDLATLPAGSPVTAECFLRTPLYRDPTDTFVSPPDNRPEYSGRYYMEPRCASSVTSSAYDSPLNGSTLYSSAFSMQEGQGQRMRMRYLLPANLTCTHCVLQWHYITANTCNVPGYRDRTWPATFSDCAGDGPGAGWWGPTLSDCGSSYPEEFWNCADISIASTGPTQSTAPSPPTVPAPPLTTVGASTSSVGSTPSTNAVTSATVSTQATPSGITVATSWNGGCTVNVETTHLTTGATWELVLTFDVTPSSSQVWNGVVTNTNGNILTISNAAWNGQHSVGDTLSLGMNLYGASSTCFAINSATLNDIAFQDRSGTTTARSTVAVTTTTAAPVSSSTPPSPAPVASTVAPSEANTPPVTNATCPPQGWTCSWPPQEGNSCCSAHGYAGSGPAYCGSGGIDAVAMGCCGYSGAPTPLSCGTPSDSGWSCSTSGSAQNDAACTGDPEVDAILEAADLPAVTGLDASPLYSYTGFCSAIRELRRIGVGSGAVPSTTGVDLSLLSMTGAPEGGASRLAVRNRVLANIASLLAQAAWESGGDAPWSACDENNYVGTTSASCTQRADGVRYDSLTSSISCPVDLNMRQTAVTHASWAPGPLECTPGTETEGCCWWGRGAIQTTGPHNVAALQRDVVANLTTVSNIDLCSNPEAICENPELRWVGAVYYWTSVVQTDACFDTTLSAYADETGFHPCATTSGCLAFNSGTGGKVNNGQWNAPAHGESGRRRYFERFMGAIQAAVRAADGSTTTAETTSTAVQQTTSTAVSGDPSSTEPASSTSPPSRMTCGAGTIADGNVCVAVCGEGTFLDATLGQCVPNCTGLRRRRDVECADCDNSHGGTRSSRRADSISTGNGKTANTFLPAIAMGVVAVVVVALVTISRMVKSPRAATSSSEPTPNHDIKLDVTELTHYYPNDTNHRAIPPDLWNQRCSKNSEQKASGEVLLSF